MNRRQLVAAASAAFLSAPALAKNRAVSKARLILTGGSIYTSIHGRPAAGAIAIEGKTIVHVGTLAEARARLPRAKEIDLAGGAAFPGFVDSHAHMTGIGLREMTLNLDSVKSISDLQAKVAAWATQNPKGPLTGRGWIETHWPEGRFPTRQDVDAIVPDRPLLLGRSDGHAALANSALLKLAGIDATTGDPPGGQILKDASGEPTGMLIDNAQALVESRMPSISPAMIREALIKADRLYASRGWTGLHNMSASGEDLIAMKALALSGDIHLRVDNYLDTAFASDVLRLGPSVDATGRISTRGVKLYSDGALGSRGAALLAPYADAPDSQGLLLTPEAQVLEVLARAKKSGAQVAMHAIGDRGNRQTLDWFEQVLGSAKTNRRWRVEHAQVVSPQDIPRFAKLGIIASMQPSHAIGDLFFAPARLGTERLKGAYAWTSLLKTGAMVCGGSDAPVEQGDPRIEFYAAMYRHALNGFVGPEWGLEERVSRQEALSMFTKSAAYAVGAEKQRGVFAPGMAASISAFSRDFMTVKPADILDAKTVLTMVDGKIVFEG
jgi:predicted amidohydrolase YtcJ